MRAPPGARHGGAAVAARLLPKGVVPHDLVHPRGDGGASVARNKFGVALEHRVAFFVEYHPPLVAVRMQATALEVGEVVASVFSFFEVRCGLVVVVENRQELAVRNARERGRGAAVCILHWVYFIQ